MTKIAGSHPLSPATNPPSPSEILTHETVSSLQGESAPIFSGPDGARTQAALSYPLRHLPQLPWFRNKPPPWGTQDSAQVLPGQRAVHNRLGDAPAEAVRWGEQKMQVLVKSDAFAAAYQKFIDLRPSLDGSVSGQPSDAVERHFKNLAHQNAVAGYAGQGYKTERGMTLAAFGELKQILADEEAWIAELKARESELTKEAEARPGDAETAKRLAQLRDEIATGEVLVKNDREALDEARRNLMALQWLPEGEKLPPPLSKQDFDALPEFGRFDHKPITKTESSWQGRRPSLQKGEMPAPPDFEKNFPGFANTRAGQLFNGIEGQYRILYSGVQALSLRLKFGLKGQDLDGVRRQFTQLCRTQGDFTNFLRTLEEERERAANTADHAMPESDEQALRTRMLAEIDRALVWAREAHDRALLQIGTFFDKAKGLGVKLNPPLDTRDMKGLGPQTPLAKVEGFFGRITDKITLAHTMVHVSAEKFQTAATPADKTRALDTMYGWVRHVIGLRALGHEVYLKAQVDQRGPASEIKEQSEHIASYARMNAQADKCVRQVFKDTVAQGRHDNLPIDVRSVHQSPPRKLNWNSTVLRGSDRFKPVMESLEKAKTELSRHTTFEESVGYLHPLYQEAGATLSELEAAALSLEVQIRYEPEKARAVQLMGALKRLYKEANDLRTQMHDVLGANDEKIRSIVGAYQAGTLSPGIRQQFGEFLQVAAKSTGYAKSILNVLERMAEFAKNQRWPVVIASSDMLPPKNFEA